MINKKNSRNLAKIILFGFLFLLPVISFAVGPMTTPSGAVIENPISSNTVEEFIGKVLVGAIKIAIPVIALAIIYAGFLFVSAQGNDEKLTKAKNALLYTCIGAAILLGAWALANVIYDTVLAL